MSKETITMSAAIPAATLARRVALAVVAVGLAVLALAVVAGPALADFGISPGSFKADVFQRDGTTFETQAGAHPSSATTSFDFNLTPAGHVDEHVRDIHVSLPPGFIGNPEAAAKCPRADFDGIIPSLSSCPDASQVGVAQIRVQLVFGTFVAHATFWAPVYNLVPPLGQTAEFGLPVQTVPVKMVATVDTAGNYGLSIRLSKVSQGFAIEGTTLTLWGDPADSAHDGLRGSCLQVLGGPTGSLCPSTAVHRPFLTNPTECAGPQTSAISVDSWESPGVWKDASYTTSVGVDGCNRLKFNPTIDVTPDSTRAGAPSGYAVDLNIRQNDDPTGIATPPLRDAVVKLPAGTSISPSAASGLGGCADAQIALHSNDAPMCPDASKIGSVEVTTPLLPDKMSGEIYLGAPTPSNMFRLFLVLHGPGLLIKIPGIVEPDHTTGQLTATFKDNPPLPFSNLHLVFKGGPRAVLSNPPTCGTATATASLTGWGVDTPAQPTSSFALTTDSNGAPCHTLGFAPAFQAGTINPTAGKDSPFTLTFSRGDADQTLSGLAVNLPPGLLGRIGSVPACPEGAANAGTCAAVSQVGTATTAAGPGSNPFNLGGRVYITGPYKGAPFGLSIVVPAIAGPFDLGTVVVRAAIFVDPTTAAVRVVSDPLPTILQGIPLQIRSVNVTLDRSGFMFNPSNCNPMSVNGVISSTAGAVANVSSRFQVGDCAVLPFRPKLAVTVGRKGHTGTRATVPLTAVLTQGKGEANNKVVDLLLPGSLNARLGPVRNACTMAAFDAGTCGSKARVGDSSAVTPVLRNPLTGSAYFVKNPKRGALPFLMVALRGQVSINLRGVITTPHGRLETRFETIPDVPISRFRLSLTDTSANGPLGAVSGLCTAANKAAKASLAFRGQNGALVKSSQKLKINGCSKAKPKTKATPKK
jgi:hypothetical protein